MNPLEAIQNLKSHFPDIAAEPVEFRGDVSIAVPANEIAAICRFLKDECRFEMLTDLCGVDNYGTEPRFSIDYNLYSFANRCRLRIRAAVSEEHPEIDSVTGVWRTADWHEREAFDMYGIRFNGHPNLKRILMWEGYPYHPLRKDFPLAGLPAELPETAINAGRVEAAPMMGGPFVPGHGVKSTIDREPRQYDTLSDQTDKSAHPTKQEPV